MTEHPTRPDAEAPPALTFSDAEWATIVATAGDADPERFVLDYLAAWLTVHDDGDAYRYIPPESGQR